METIPHISNIPLHYARQTQSMYGTQGVPQSFQIESEFLEQMTECFDELFAECPLGKPNVITCAGIYVDRAPSMHTYGRAFDLDALFWDNYNLVSLNFHNDKELYLGIESFLRLHNGIVLSYYYNDDHKDHWHIDNSVENVDFHTGSESSVYYLQLVSTYIYEHPVEIDGIYGPQTEGAINHIKNLLGLTGNITTPNTYKAILRKTGKLAFLKFEQNKSPLTLLNNVYDVVSSLNIDTGKRITINAALNDFRNHQETDEWLVENYLVDSNLEQLINQVV